MELGAARARVDVEPAAGVDPTAGARQMCSAQMSRAGLNVWTDYATWSLDDALALQADLQTVDPKPDVITRRELGER